MLWLSFLWRWIDGEPSERRLKVLTALGLIPVIGFIPMVLIRRDMDKLDERISRFS